MPNLWNAGVSPATSAVPATPPPPPTYTTAVPDNGILYLSGRYYYVGGLYAGRPCIVTTTRSGGLLITCPCGLHVRLVPPMRPGDRIPTCNHNTITRIACERRIAAATFHSSPESAHHVA